MIYAIRSYEVQTADVPAFIAAFERDTPWRQLSYQIDAHLHTGLLVRSTIPPTFVSLAIWQCEEQFTAAENSVDYLNFNRSLRILSTAIRV